MLIKGLQKTSLVDYPPYMVATVFVGGCNFRCGYCHNPDLVNNYKEIPTIPEDEVLDYLTEKKKWLDGVCISGGEPTIYPDLPDFCNKIKKLGMLVKVDTNGSNPELLRELINRKLVDYISMDIKSSLKRYNEASGAVIDREKVKESAALLMKSKIGHEFRSTVVPGFFDENDAKEIGKWLKGAKKYVLQQFRSNVELVDKKFMGKEPYTSQELKKFKKILEPYFKIVEIRE